MWGYEDDINKLKCVPPIEAPRSTLDELSKRDYQGKNYLPSGFYAPVVDPDSYETCLQKGYGNQDHSMDAALYIPSQHAYLLVEMRMGYENCRNLSFSDMEDKLVHTKRIMSPTACLGECYFLFKENVAETAKGYIRNLLLEYNKRSYVWNVCTPDEFGKEEVIGVSRLPIQYKHAEVEIFSSLSCHLSDWDAFLKQVEYWINKGKQYEWTNKVEQLHIHNILRDYLLQVKNNQTFTAVLPDAGDYLDIVLEDL